MTFQNIHIAYKYQVLHNTSIRLYYIIMYEVRVVSVYTTKHRIQRFAEFLKNLGRKKFIIEGSIRVGAHYAGKMILKK